MHTRREPVTGMLHTENSYYRIERRFRTTPLTEELVPIARPWKQIAITVVLAVAALAPLLLGRQLVPRSNQQPES
jgi:hypothetical protein